MLTILASASPRRRELLTTWGVSFEILPAHGLDESLVTGAAPEVVSTLALQKARRSRELWLAGGNDPDGARFLGSDTVVEHEGRILGKPTSREDARAMLDSLSGRTHRVLTAVAVVGPGESERTGRVVAEVTFRELDADAIERHLDSGDHEGKAGSYGIQSEGAKLVESFSGCYYAIVGLPWRLTLRLLGQESPPCDCRHRPRYSGGEDC